MATPEVVYVPTPPRAGLSVIFTTFVFDPFQIQMPPWLPLTSVLMMFVSAPNAMYPPARMTETPLENPVKYWGLLSVSRRFGP